MERALPSKLRFPVLVVVVVCLLAAGVQWTAGARDDLYASATPRFKVETVDYDWFDAARDREVPTRVYYPHEGGSDVRDHPVVVFSHGLWGSRAGYEYFGQHMASVGYVVIAPSHIGSTASSIACITCDLGILLDSLTKDRYSERGLDLGLFQNPIDDLENLRNRPLDISFVLDQINSVPRLSAATDESEVGVAGHSFGAFTAMAVGGMRIDPDDAEPFFMRDPRINAVLAMSAPGPGRMGISENAWEAFSVPAMFLTGSRDYGSTEEAARWRETAFRQMAGVDRILATLEGAQHASFGRLAERAHRAGTSAPRLAYIKALSAAFFDAHLKHDEAAISWLNSLGSGVEFGEVEIAYR